MNWKKVFSKIYRWLLRGFAVLAVPALFPASVSMGERIGWAGIVLFWFYTGRLVENRKDRGRKQTGT
jgi:hypothetical protein